MSNSMPNDEPTTTNEKKAATQFHVSRREYFAAKAMQGMIAGSQGLEITTKQFASQSVKLADALIAELATGE